MGAVGVNLARSLASVSLLATLAGQIVRAWSGAENAATVSNTATLSRYTERGASDLIPGTRRFNVLFWPIYWIRPRVKG
jgi:hypothetical protein